MDPDQKPVKLTLNKTLHSRDTTLRVEGFMQPGTYEVQLVVCDEFGNTSSPYKHLFTVTSPIGLAQKVGYFIAQIFNKLL